MTPLLVVERAGPVLPLDSLRATLAEALSPLARAGAAAYRQRLMEVSLSYSYRLVGPTGPGVRAECPVLLADHVTLTTGQDPGARHATDLDRLAERLANNVGIWTEHAKPSTADAALSLAVILFADINGSQLPIVTVQDLEITVSNTWW